MKPTKMSKWSKGYYKVTFGDKGFSNIRKETFGPNKNKWIADIRKPNGELRRFAGIWNTLKDALEEVMSIFEHIHYW